LGNFSPDCCHSASLHSDIKWQEGTSIYCILLQDGNFKHNISFNNQLFLEKESGSLWAIHKLSEPWHAGQMHERFGCQMTLVIFVVPWFAPGLWNENRGFFEDFYTSQFGLWLIWELYISPLGFVEANYLESHLHFG